MRCRPESRCSAAQPLSLANWRDRAGMAAPWPRERSSGAVTRSSTCRKAAPGCQPRRTPPGATLKPVGQPIACQGQTADPGNEIRLLQIRTQGLHHRKTGCNLWSVNTGLSLLLPFHTPDTAGGSAGGEGIAPAGRLVYAALQRGLKGWKQAVSVLPSAKRSSPGL